MSTVQKPKGKSLRPYCYIVLSCVFFSIMSVLVKLNDRIPSFQSAFSRAFINFSLNASLQLYEKVPISQLMGTKRNQIFLLFVRGMVGSIGMIGGYYSFTRLHLGDSAAIRFTSPVWTAILARLLLNEQLFLAEVISVPIVIAGVTLVVRPQFMFGKNQEPEPWDGIIAAFAAAWGAAGAYCLVRKINSTYPETHTLTIVNALQLAVFCISPLLAFLFEQSFVVPTTTELMILTGVGICGFGGQYALTAALRLERAGPLIALRTLDIPLVFIWQEILFEHSSQLLLSSIGATIIVSGSLNITLNKYFREKRIQEKVPHIQLEEITEGDDASDEMLSDALKEVTLDEENVEFVHDESPRVDEEIEI